MLLASVVTLLCFQAITADEQYLIGCFRNYGKGYWPKSMGNVRHAAECMYRCRKAGFAYAGVFFGEYCYCGQAYEQKPLSDDCTMICQNGDHNCGGILSMSIYKTNPPFPQNQSVYAGKESDLVGCFKDNEHQYLPKRMGTVKTVSTCRTKCKNAGFSFAGLHDGDQCFCGNFYQTSQPAHNCKIKCHNSTNICGGYFAHSIYRTYAHATSSKKYLIGCFKDNIKGYSIVGSVDSAEECIQTCRYKRYFYAGVKFGTICSCGYKVDLANVGTCKSKCRNFVDICGGLRAYSIYKTHY